MIFVAASVIIGIIVLVLYFTPALHPIEPYAIVLISAGSPIVIWWLERKARKLDALNGNLMRMVASLSILRGLQKDKLIYNALPEHWQRGLVLIEHNLGNVTTKLQGFRELSEIRRDALRSAGLDDDE